MTVYGPRCDRPVPTARMALDATPPALNAARNPSRNGNQPMAAAAPNEAAGAIPLIARLLTALRAAGAPDEAIDAAITGTPMASDIASEDQAAILAFLEKKLSPADLAEARQLLNDPTGLNPPPAMDNPPPAPGAPIAPSDRARYPGQTVYPSVTAAMDAAAGFHARYPKRAARQRLRPRAAGASGGRGFRRWSRHRYRTGRPSRTATCALPAWR